ncbi:hypothetical protein J6590_097917 [Homalodisca vitripennis]|nr:hypothetical protein J6590_097917 [Homalodisca vitripennis]
MLNSKSVKQESMCCLPTPVTQITALLSTPQSLSTLLCRVTLWSPHPVQVQDTSPAPTNGKYAASTYGARFSAILFSTSQPASKRNWSIASWRSSILARFLESDNSSQDCRRLCLKTCLAFARALLYLLKFSSFGDLLNCLKHFRRSFRAAEHSSDHQETWRLFGEPEDFGMIRSADVIILDSALLIFHLGHLPVEDGKDSKATAMGAWSLPDRSGSTDQCTRVATTGLQIDRSIADHITVLGHMTEVTMYSLELCLHLQRVLNHIIIK